MKRTNHEAHHAVFSNPQLRLS